MGPILHPLTWRTMDVAALHALHWACQGLRVLAGDGTSGAAAVVAPLTVTVALPHIPILTALGWGDRGTSLNHAPLPSQASRPPRA